MEGLSVCSMDFIDDSPLDDGGNPLSALEGGLENTSDEVVDAALDPDGKHDTVQLQQRSDSEGYTSGYMALLREKQNLHGLQCLDIDLLTHVQRA